ncbi:MAG: DegV family protein [Ruminococcaceae bacterium]|nr:DegV family protein [Oscillospiraceae bacterium]
MNYKIVADSSSNLFAIEGVDYGYVPLKIICGDKEYYDVPQQDVFEMLQELKEANLPSTTSCPNAFEWKEAFGEAEGVFAITITSNLSGSCAAANQAKLDYEEEHPGRRVSVLDTLSVGPEARLIIEKLRELIAQGLPFDEVDAQIRTYMQHTHLLFSLESLENLARNGRVNPAVAKVVGVLGIRIVGKASDVGTLQQLHKCRGQKRAIATVLQEMKEHGYCGGKVRIDHALNLGAAVELKELIVKEFPDAAVEIGTCTALCSFYAERGGMLVGYEG